MPTKAASTKATTKTTKTAAKTAAAATTKATTKTATATKAKTGTPAVTGYLRMIVDAIHDLHVRGGSSRQAIKSWLQTNRPDAINEDAFERAVRQALKKGVESSILLQNGQSFRVNPDIIKPEKKTATKTKTDAVAKPAATKAAAPAKKAATTKKTTKPVAATAAKRTAAPKKKTTTAAAAKKTTSKPRAASTKK